ncbi:hypothetical protein [Sphingomonas sp.]|jgi:hypothetical protein|uniref:hypothetical protein n=1 Tax=Sphingomonas sp. TaxID=28214 RepID=UPI002E378B83|nr:hypothetical protein [Sphingomonas sp.]HEX4692972.1 hypothetical protein [Sphingomonas sp.]
MVNMGNVWDRTTEFLSDNAAALWPIAALAVFVPQSVAALIGGAANGGIAPIVVAATALVCALVSIWGQLAITALAIDPEAGRDRAIAAASANYLRAILAMLVLLVGLALLSLPIGATLAASGIDIGALRRGDQAALSSLSGGAAAFVAIYAIALAVVALIVTVRVTLLLYPVVVAEKLGVGALRRAFMLSNGMAWKMFGVWLLFVIVYLVASAAVKSAIGGVLGLFLGNTQPFGLVAIVVALLSGLVTMAYVLVTASFFAKLYRAATKARDGAAKA